MNKILVYLKASVGKEAPDSPSPLMRWLNPTILKVEAGYLEFSYTVSEDMTNPLKILHGGTTAALIDEIIGATVYTLDRPQVYTTVNLAVDYFGTARVGDTIIALGSIVKAGDKIINAQCEVWNENKSRMTARGYSNLIKSDYKNI
ncbi:MAG: PaaI family thioesterase [Eudoraea sp.]|nr:PaaI family thioesterase [Eudoraea sp.]